MSATRLLNVIISVFSLHLHLKSFPHLTNKHCNS